MHENDKGNVRIIAITLMIVAALGVILTIAKTPKTSELNSIKSQITATDHAIADAKENAKRTSPIKKDFDLNEAKGLTQDKIIKGLKLGLGGCKNTKDYNAHKKEIASLVGKDLADEMYKMNGAPDLTYDLPDGKPFKFILSKDTIVYVTFEKVTNIHDAKIPVLVEYGETDGNSNKVTSKHFMIGNFEYDLTNQKFISGELHKFTNSNLSE